MNEIWKDIKGYEGKYQVSNTGKVKSLNYNNTGNPKELKYNIQWTGLATVKLSKNNIAKEFMVARLVAEAFIPNHSNKPQIMHISKNILDNSVENLKWAYPSEIKFLMYKRGSRKIGVPSENKISYKGKRYKNYSELAKDYGLKSKLLDRRLRNGWTLEEALEIPLQRKELILKKRLYEYEGKLYSVKELSKKFKIDSKCLYKRLARRWSIEEAVEIPLARMRKED